MVKKHLNTEDDWEEYDVGRTDKTIEDDLVKERVLKWTLSAPKLTASASIGIVSPDERQKLGYNFLALCSLGYRFNHKSQCIECTMCNYSFHKNEFYDYDLHCLQGSKGKGVQCPVWLKGGFTLNPRETQMAARSNGTAIEPTFVLSSTFYDATEQKMHVDETITESDFDQDSIDLDSDQIIFLVHNGPKENLDESEMAINLTEDDSEESFQFLSRENREDSLVKLNLWSCFTPTFAIILSLMGFYSFSDTLKMLKCFYCKFLSPETSLRTLIRAHSAFSPRCCYAKFVDISTEETSRPEDTAAHLIAFNIFNNLKTFTDRCFLLSEAICVEAAACGLRFRPFTYSVICTACDFEADLEDSDQNRYLTEMHLKHNPKCLNLGDSVHMEIGRKQKGIQFFLAPQNAKVLSCA
ncbi:uncharacterized protein LOC134846168 isoform X2 [Symsagittifera roscoffensis]|uniref:uncharacterized protein LOC134846168 isoform X2 n=1 Tax=Symsagittifera roscoffensis TaxID=84072 RepID=UPI00307B13D5